MGEVPAASRKSVTVLVVEVAGGPNPGGGVHRTLKLASVLADERFTVRLMLLSAGLTQSQLSSGYGIAGDAVEWVPCLNKRFHIAAPQFWKIQRSVASADVVCFSSFLWGAAPWVWLAARLAGKPWIVSPLGVLPYFGRSMAAKRAAHWLFGRRLLGGAAVIVAVTSLEARSLRPFAGKSTKIRVVPNGIDPGAMSKEADSDGGNDTPYALYLGRLDAVKGLDLLFDALALVRSRGLAGLRLVVAGEGPQRPALEDKMARLGLQSQISFHGVAEANAKFGLLRRAAFVVIPSRRDAMTQVALEAGLAGRPLLLSRACGFDEAIECGGALGVDPRVDDLAEGWMRMHDQAERWNEMGTKLQALVVDHYSWGAIARRFRAVVDEALTC